MFVLLKLWLVYHFPRFFAVFRRWRTKLMRRENGTKLKNLTFDLNFLRQRGPIKFSFAFAS